MITALGAVILSQRDRETVAPPLTNPAFLRSHTRGPAQYNYRDDSPSIECFFLEAGVQCPALLWGLSKHSPRELVGLEAPTFTEGNSSTLHSSQDRGKVDQAKVKPNIYIT
ncbi:hypothetical protein CapIbe_010854 [Capra ibex]